MDNNNKALLVAIAVVILFFTLGKGTFLGAVTGTATYSYETLPSSIASAQTLLAPCESSWQCISWSDCQPDGTQTRTCTDVNSCSPANPDNPNALSQSCTYIPPTCDASHLEGDLIKTICSADKKNVEKMVWSCSGVTWGNTTSTSLICASNQECSVKSETEAECKDLPSGGGGGGGGGSYEPVTTPAVTSTAVISAQDTGGSFMDKINNISPKIKVLALIIILYLVYAYTKKIIPFNKRR